MPSHPAPKPVKTTAAAPVDPKVAARGAQIRTVAKAEVGTRETVDASGMVTGRVREYYRSSAQVRPHRDWDWPGYFVAWARETAGAPITPPGHQWLKIDELIAQAKQHQLWDDKPAQHAPIAGEVVLMNMGVTDRTANNAAIVTGVEGNQLRIVQGWSGTRGNRSVTETTIARTDPRIRGYIGIANGGTRP